MNFADPLWLLALLVVPLLLAAGWSGRRRARRYAVRFPAVASVAAAVGEVRGRTFRGLALGALVLALVAGILAIARPRLRHRVPVGNADFMLVLDHSGSMAATDVAPTRIAAAIAAGNTFIHELPANAKVGLVAFGSTPDAVQAPVADHGVTQALLDAQQAGGGTDTGPALAQALALLHGSSARHPPAAIVLLSDGAANRGESPVGVAQRARAEHTPIFTVALGTDAGVLNEGIFGTIPVPPDPQLMDAIARASGGRSFRATNAGDLSTIYKTLGDRLGSVVREREIGLWLVLAAAVLALLAALASLRSAPRLP